MGSGSDLTTSQLCTNECHSLRASVTALQDPPRASVSSLLSRVDIPGSFHRVFLVPQSRPQCWEKREMLAQPLEAGGEVQMTCIVLFCSDTLDAHLVGTNTVLHLLAGWLWTNGFTSLWNVVSSFTQLSFLKKSTMLLWMLKQCV